MSAAHAEREREREREREKRAWETRTLLETEILRWARGETERMEAGSGFLEFTVSPVQRNAGKDEAGTLVADFELVPEAQQQQQQQMMMMRGRSAGAVMTQHIGPGVAASGGAGGSSTSTGTAAMGRARNGHNASAGHRRSYSGGMGMVSATVVVNSRHQNTSLNQRHGHYHHQQQQPHAGTRPRHMTRSLSMGRDADVTMSKKLSVDALFAAFAADVERMPSFKANENDTKADDDTLFEDLLGDVSPPVARNNSAGAKMARSPQSAAAPPSFARTAPSAFSPSSFFEFSPVLHARSGDDDVNDMSTCTTSDTGATAAGAATQENWTTFDNSSSSNNSDDGSTHSFGAAPASPNVTTTTYTFADGSTDGEVDKKCAAGGRVTPSDDTVSATTSTSAGFHIPYDELDFSAARKIGRGGFGDVVLAVLRGRQVAVKKISSGIPAAGTDAGVGAESGSSASVRDFKHEARVLCKLRHENIIEFIGSTTARDEFMIIMEFCSNGSLRNILRDETRPLSSAQVVRWCVETARGLQYLHSREPPVCHRDLKSVNLLINEDMQLKVSDFGLARCRTSSYVVTQVGTYAWMSPEVLENCPYTERADVYSFGVVMWEVITRKEPWKGLHPMQIMRAIDRGERPVLTADMIRVPAITIGDEYDLLLQQCWHSDPELRPDFDEILQRLETILEKLEMDQEDAPRDCTQC